MTTWSPRSVFDRRSWLLTDGTVVTEPALEESPSGRKVRVAGTKITAWEKDLDSLVLKAVSQAAIEKQTRVWIGCELQAETMVNSLGFDPDQTGAPKLHTIHTPTMKGAETHYWWKFRHGNLPVEFVLAVSIRAENNRGASDTAIKTQTIHSRLVGPDMYPVSITDPYPTMDFQTVINHEPDFNGQCLSAGNGDYNHGLRAREFVRDNPCPWTTESDPLLKPGYTHANERAGVEALYSLVRRLDDLQTIQTLDLRDPDNPAWLDLELHDTNVGNAQLSEMSDYLDSVPNTAAALEHYVALLQVLRSNGLVLAPITENHFHGAMQSGDTAGFTAEVSPVADLTGIDTDHTVTLHVPSGTIIVNCSLRDADKNTVAEAWDEALVLAQLTGQEDELLAYARAFGDQKAKKRRHKIMRERRAGTNE